VLFQSASFLVVFLLTLLAVYFGVYWLCRGRVGGANLVLFLGSVAFYLWGERFQGILLLTSLVMNYGLGLLASKRAKLASWLAVVLNLCLLFWFKYAGFVCGQFGLEVSTPKLLPLAISFFTFQAMSYVLDVARGQVPAEKNFIRFGVFVFLFPHLIAGPIVRYKHLAASLRERTISAEQFADGVQRFMLGLAKKLILADTFAAVADQAFGYSPGALSAGAAWLGVVCYALQVYFDFSGYSCMAIGLAKMFGFEFQENFQYPYIAQSLTEFWKRWHISLSSWFRDYLYIPLGGNRGSSARTVFNLLVVFVLCGLWHGANWTYLVWGLLHGGVLILERFWLGKVIEKTWMPLRFVYMQMVLMLSWVLFRCESLTHAFNYLKAMVRWTPTKTQVIDLWSTKMAWMLPIGVVCCLPWRTWLLSWKPNTTNWLPSLTRNWIAVATLVLFWMSMSQLVAGKHVPFIYFRF
jgi:alginate O-acetyltransferase complex protein AlgI